MPCCTAPTTSAFCFSPLDNITPAVEGQLADFSFVRLKDTCRGAVSNMPFQGEGGWYHRVAVEYGLHMGLLTWDTLLYSLSSTAHLPKDAFEKPLVTMDACWADPDLALGANSLIGLMAHDESANFSCITAEEEPRLGHFCKRTVFYENGRTTDWIYQTKHLDNARLFPIHLQILCTEGVRVAQALYIIEKLGVPAPKNENQRSRPSTT